MQMEDGPQRDLAIRQELDTVRQLVERHGSHTRQLLNIERLSIVANHVLRRQGANLNEVDSPPPECSLMLVNSLR